MNFFDLLQKLLKQYKSVEDLIEKINRLKKSRKYKDDSPEYYEEIIKILDSEIKELNKKLNEKINLKKEFEEKAKAYRNSKKNHDQKEQKNKRHQKTSDYSYDSTYNEKDHSFDPKLAKHYAALEIPYGSNLETVKKAYRTLLKKYHPDFYHHDPEKQKTATVLTQKLSEAYQALEKHLKGK